MSQSKISAFLSLVLVFLSGGVLGACAYRLYMVNAIVTPASVQHRPSVEEFRKRYLADLQKYANLDGQQIAQVNQVLDEIGTETKQKMTAIHDEQIDRINAILSPEQRAAYKKMRDEHDAERARRRQQQQNAQPK
jgi:hypothetical protein